MKADKKKPFHELVAEKLIAQLRAGTAPWQRPWESGRRSTFPMNPTTGKRYRGINAIYLMMQGREDSRWMTYKQAAGINAQVRKSEKGTPIQYWKFTEERDKEDDAGNVVLDAEGKPVRITVRLEKPKVFTAYVFNAEQIDGLEPLPPLPACLWDALERAESILRSSGAVLEHVAGNRACYRPMADLITLPRREQFLSADRYYATALHELAHWTGHESRLNRPILFPFGSVEYAKEELRAEITSLMLGEELQIGHDPEQHAAYVGSWIKVVQDDPFEVFRAAADAEKIQEYLLGFERELTWESEEEMEV